MCWPKRVARESNLTGQTKENWDHDQLAFIPSHILINVLPKPLEMLCLSAVSKRLVYRLLNDGDPVFRNEISYATCRSPEHIEFFIPSPYPEFKLMRLICWVEQHINKRRGHNRKSK